MSHKITRQAALVEINGEVLVLKLSPAGWAQVLAIAAKEGSGQLVVAPAPNQSVLDVLDTPVPKMQPVDVVRAWLHEDDPTRVISAPQKAQAERDGGGSASSVRPYSIALK